MNFETYEPVIMTTYGPIPESALKEVNEDRAKAEAKRRAAEAERLKNTPPFVLCPLASMSAINCGCHREKCALFVDNTCSLAKIAAGNPAGTTGKRCPIQGRTCSADCALNIGGGCIITAYGKE